LRLYILTAAAILLLKAAGVSAQGHAEAGAEKIARPAAAVSGPIFSDAFNTGALDANKWRAGLNAGNNSSVANGALELRSLAAPAGGAESGWVITRNAYAARNTMVQVKVVKPNNDGALGVSPTYYPYSKFGIAGQKNWYRFYVYRSGNAGSYRLFVQWKKNGVENGLEVTGTLVINGAVYLRLRFDDTHIHFEASLNGATWTDTYAEAFALPGYTLDSAFFYELTGYNTGVNGVLRVDDFSINTGAAPIDAQPPQISQVAVQNITSSSAQITWQTDELADSQAEYGLTSGYGKLAALNSTLVTTHLAALSGLQANKTYHYRARSKDGSGNLAVSGDFVFTTLPAPTPALTMASPNGGEWWFTGESREIKWTAASSIANVKLDYSRDAGVTWRTIAASTPNDGAFTWLVPDTVSNANLIRISDAANANVADVSNKAFFIIYSALVKFTPAKSNPVLSPGPLGSWDERITERGWFMYENGMYHAWYGGWKGNYDHAVSNFVKLGYAFSTDGVHWTKYSGNPIYSQHWIEDVVVVKNGDTYCLYAENEYAGDGDWATIDLYISSDRVNWTRYGKVLSPAGTGWESNQVGTATVWKETNKWYMLYEGFGSGSAGKVGLATSQDGKSWTRHAKNPVLINPLDNNLDIAIDSIIKINGFYYAYGHYDTGGSNWVVGMFTSTDLIAWTAYRGNPFPDNFAVIVDNGSHYFFYGVGANPDGLAPYYLQTSRYVPDIKPPVISGVAISNLTGISAKISWKTGEAADSQIEYGLTTGYGASSKLDPNYVITHAITLTGLQPNTKYHYRLKSRDDAGNLAVSGDLTFTTSATIFSDKFDAAVLDANKWRRGGNSGNQSAVVNNALELRSTGRESGWVITKNAYAARNTRVKVKVVKPNDDGVLGIRPSYDLSSKSGITDQKNWYRFYVYRDNHTGPYRLYVECSKNGAVEGRDVTPQSAAISGSVYLRLRFDAAKIHFEASLDGTAWTEAYAEAFALPGYTLDSPFYYELSAYNTQANGALIVDDFIISSPKNGAAKPEAENLAAAPPPSAFVLQSYPNPFNAATRIEFALPQDAEVQLSVFDLTGREVQQLLAGERAAGNYRALWNGKNREGIELGSGVYFLRLRYRSGQTGAWAQLVQRVTMLK
jgi:hypothetical protein